MRYEVVDPVSPFDCVGYLEAPPPEALAQRKFRYSWPTSAYMNDHPRHFDMSARRAPVELELGIIRHLADCPCKPCVSGNPPKQRAAFMRGDLSIEELRHVRGFHPLQIIIATPAGAGTSAPSPGG